MPRIVVLLAALLLTACQTGSPTGSPASTFGENTSINWERNPDTVVFRVEIVGGGREAEFNARNDIAPCTIYGDNRVVWLNQLSANESQVLFDQVSDQAIRSFIEYLTVVDQIFNYPGKADVQIPSTTLPVYETIEVNVSGQNFMSDAFAGWPPDYYQRILNRCQNISQTPVLYEPSAAWLSVTPVDYSFERPSYPWDAAAAGLSLAEVQASGARRWVSDNLVRVFWNLLRTNPPGFRLIENDQMYAIALEIPNVTRYSPPPPTG